MLRSSSLYLMSNSETLRRFLFSGSIMSSTESSSAERSEDFYLLGLRRLIFLTLSIINQSDTFPPIYFIKFSHANMFPGLSHLFPLSLPNL